MFAGWGSWVARFRWSVLAVALVAVIGAGVWGLGVFGQLSEGGYNDPNSESTRAGEVAQEAFGARGGDLVAIYTPTAGKIDDAALGKRIRERLAALPESAVARSTSYWNQKSEQYAAEDKSSAIAVITLAGAGDDDKLDNFRDIEDRFSVDGASVKLSGAVVLADASSTRSTEDLAKAELISLPVTLVLLVLLFGSVVAASLPVLVGGAAVLGSLGILHAIASQQEINSFAVNVASLLGLGMAIDYGLFMVGRFREELAGGRTPAEAVRRTLATAGRTVAFSATLLMIALGGLLLFPQGFLNSLAYGGLAAVFLAALLSLTLLPALLAVLGRHVEKLPVRLPGRKGAAEGTGWRKLAGFVLRRPVLVVLPILAGLLLLAAPIRGVHFGESDERILPPGDPARQAIEMLQADYPQFSGDGVQIVLRGAGDSAGFAVAARQVPGISELSSAEKAKGVTLFTATLRTTDPFSDDARDVVDALRSLPVPPGAELLVGGTTARNVDSLSATADRLPLMIGVLAGATLLLMFLAFGSVLLPIKAVAMSALSLSATFGTLVWIFQDGHGAGLLNVTPAPLEVGIVVLMAAVVFGLSTDYEVFLLSRMVEARARGASTAEAVTTGLARTGRVISAAAVLLIVVTGAFALSSVATMRFVGVGMIIALLLDATVVRMLLAPAVLSLLGDAAWWAPGPLRRLQQRAGLAEHAGEETEPATVRAGASDDTAVLTGVVGYGPASARSLPASASASSTAATSAAVASAAAASAAAASTAAVSSLASTTAAAAAGTSAAGRSTADRSAAGRSVAKPLPGEPSWIPATGELPALPAASSPLALPAGPADVTEILPKFDEVSSGNGFTTEVFGGRPAEPSFVASASSGGAHTDRPAPDEFYFGSSPGGYGLPVEPPAVEPPAPWRLPEITAGPTPAGAEPPTSGDDTDLDVTRSFDAPDLDATRTLIAPDLASTRQMPAPILRPHTSDDADQPPADHIPPSVETSQRIFTRTESSIGRIPPVRDKDPDPTPPAHDPDTHRTPASGRVPTVPPTPTPAGGHAPAPPAPGSTGGGIPADTDRIPTQRGQAAGRIPAPRAPEPDRIPTQYDPAAARFAPEPEVVEEEPDLDVTRSLDAPDLDATRTLIAPDLASTRQMPAPILRPQTSDDADQPPADHISPSVETSQRIFTRTESSIGRIPPVRDTDPGDVPTWRDPAAARFTPEPEVVEEEPDLDVTRSLDAPDLDATRTLIAPDLASTRQMPAPLIPKSRQPKQATDDAAPTNSPAAPLRPASGPMPVPRPAQTPDPRYVRDTPGPVPPTARPAEVTRPPQTTARPDRTDPARPAAAPYVEPRRPAAHADLPTQHIPGPGITDPARPAAAGPYAEPRRPAAHADLPTQRTPRPETTRPAAPASADIPTQRRRADLGNAFATRRPADPSIAPAARQADDFGVLPAQRRAEDFGGIPVKPDGLADIPARRQPEELGDPLPLRRPATLGDQPYSVHQQRSPQPAEPQQTWQPTQARQPDETLPARQPGNTQPANRGRADAQQAWQADTQPIWQPTAQRAIADQAWRPAEATPARRPADLRDHLRESRPADLSQYSRRGQPARGQVPAPEAPGERPRRPASLGDFPPARRPATLADHVRARRSADEPADRDTDT